MKDLLKFKNTLCCGVRHCGRVLSLIAVLTAFSSSAWATTYKILGSSILGLDSGNPKDMTDAGSNKHTWSFTSTNSGNNEWFKIFKNSQSDANQVGCAASENHLAIGSEYNYEIGKQTQFYIDNLENGVGYTITLTDNGLTVQIKITKSSTPGPTPTPGGDCLKFDTTGSNTRTETNQFWFKFDGLGSTYSTNTSNYTLTYTSIDHPEHVSDIEINTFQGSGDATVMYCLLKTAGADGWTSDNRKITIVYDDGEKQACGIAEFNGTSFVVKSDYCCSSPSTETPIVYWEKYPTIGNNTIDMFGYLAERYCSNVTEAGFYWKETNDITADDIENPATNHKFTATTNPAKNNDSFSRTTPDLSEIITEPTTIYLVNYVTTAGGGTGISDVVALAYSPCFPIPEGGVTLNNTDVDLPEGYKFTFEATARSAGKAPVYKWYLDASTTPIEGAVSNTYEFTMPDANNHTIKVEVTGDCGVSREATASITSCTMPAVTLTAETSTTPWAAVTITATPTAVASAEWSVEPNAELKSTSTSGATFRAGTPAKYAVKYVGASSDCDATVNAEAEIEITVNADSEDCVNPNAE